MVNNDLSVLFFNGPSRFAIQTLLWRASKHVFCNAAEYVHTITGE